MFRPRIVSTTVNAFKRLQNVALYSDAAGTVDTTYMEIPLYDVEKPQPLEQRKARFDILKLLFPSLFYHFGASFESGIPSRTFSLIPIMIFIGVPVTKNVKCYVESSQELVYKFAEISGNRFIPYYKLL